MNGERDREIEDLIERLRDLGIESRDDLDVKVAGTYGWFFRKIQLPVETLELIHLYNW